MTQENLAQVPPMLLDIFADYGLELPPLPLNILPALSPAGNELFATGVPPAWVLRNTPTSLSFADLVFRETQFYAADGEPREAPPRDALADADGGEEDEPDEEADGAPGENGEPAGEMPYFLCGFSGSGLQNRVFLYCYSSSRLRVGITIPFNHAYADPERERAEFARVMELLVLVLQCTREGANLGTDDAGTLFWIRDWHGSSFQVRNGNGEVILAGDTTDALLDYLERRRGALLEDAAGTQFWVRV